MPIPISLTDFWKEINPYIFSMLPYFLDNSTLIDDAVKDYSFIKKLPFHTQSHMPVVYRVADIFCLRSLSRPEL